jgi:hypothetical protein
MDKFLDASEYLFNIIMVIITLAILALFLGIMSGMFWRVFKFVGGI